MAFNEDSRVKIPTILHLVRLGYDYLSLKNAAWDEETNIFTSVFKESVLKINENAELHDVERLLEDINLSLETKI